MDGSQLARVVAAKVARVATLQQGGGRSIPADRPPTIPTAPYGHSDGAVVARDDGGSQPTARAMGPGTAVYRCYDGLGRRALGP